MLHNWFHKTLLAVVSLALILAARGSVATAQTLTGTITVVNHRTDLDKDGTLAKYSAAFTKLNPGVTVNWETMTDYEGEVATRMNTKDYGDVLNIPRSLSADKYPNFFTSLGTVDDL